MNHLRHLGTRIFLMAAVALGALTASSPVSALPPRGVASDYWADVIIGKPDFSEINPNTTVSHKLWLPHGVIVDRTSTPNRMYVYDGGNNRILGLDLGRCLSSTTDPLNCSADLVIGQPNAGTSACNGDSGFQDYPLRAPASNATMCGLQESQLSISEGGSGASMALDLHGNLYVPDFWNHRILKFLSPFTTDAIADDVWGQSDFVGNACNRDGSSPDATTLCFTWGNSNNWTAGVEVDSAGNLWVTDSGNNRVLRFPAGAKTADLVLGQPDFSSATPGSALTRFNAPSAIRVNSQGLVYVTDQGNDRVLAFDTPLTSGMAGRVFGSGFKAPAGLDFDPTQPGVWITNFGYNTIELWDETAETKIEEIGSRGDGNVLGDATGSVGIDSLGNMFVAIGTGNYDNDVLVFAKSGPLITPTARVFGGHSGNLVTPFSIGSAHGIVAADNQLIVQDQSGRILFWDDPSSLTDGRTADGTVETGIDSLAMKADQNHHLYVSVAKDPDRLIEIQVYKLPLTPGAIPSKTVGVSSGAFALSVPLLGGGGITLSTALWGLAPTPAGDFLWVSDGNNSRVVRIRHPLTNPRVDVILGQTNPSDTLCNRDGAESVDALPDTLCYPGSLSLDRFGNLYVSDHSLEIRGNMRLLEFDSALFPSNNRSVIYAPPASKIFPRIATWEPAFDSQNRMVVGYNPFWTANPQANPNGGWFPGVYNDPLSLSTPLPDVPDAYLNDYYSMAFTATFDDEDNLYVGDLDRARVLLYRTPLGGIPNLPELTGSWARLTQTCHQRSAGMVCSLSGTFKLWNLGAQKAAPSKVRFYLSGDALPDGGDLLLKEIPTSALRPGRTRSLRLVRQLPSATSGSGQFVIAVVDSHGSVTESNESNNVIVFGAIP